METAMLTIALMALVVLVLVTYAISLRNGFAWDDTLFIRNNSFIQNPGNLTQIIVSDDAVGTGMTNPYYRPVTTLTFAAESMIWGDNSTGYHATNVFLHLAACILLFFTAKHFMSLPGAFVAAALFAVHPANSEPVAYISARADLLCGVFLLLSFLSYLRFSETSLRRYFAVSLFAFALALFSKIVAILFPALLFVYLILPERRIRAWRHLLPYLAVVIAFMAIRSSVVEMERWGATPFVTRLATSGTLMLAYIRYTVFPFGMKVFYDLPIRTTFSDPLVMGSWAMLCGVVFLTFWSRRGYPRIFFGIVWYFATLLPVSGIAMLLYPTLIADRYLYIPLMGVSLAVGVLADRVASSGFFNRNRVPAQAAFAVLVLVASGYTASRVAVWKDDLTLWAQATQDAPVNAIPKYNCGVTLMAAERFEEAERYFIELRKMGDQSAEVEASFAVIKFFRGDLAGAEQHIQAAILKKPDNAAFLAWYGRAMLIKGDLEKAAKSSQSALQLEPSLFMARDTMEVLRNVAVNTAD
jgi:tetratricopeptide (TPR) repeat protein